MKNRTGRQSSIRRRLLVLLLVPVAAVLVAGSLGDVLLSSAPVRQAYDEALSDAAIALALNVQVDAAGNVRANVQPEVLNLLRTDLQDQIFYRIEVPGIPLVAGDAGLPPATAGNRNPSYMTARYGNNPVRLATYKTETRAGTLTVTVAETLHKRQQIRAQLISSSAWTDVCQLVLILSCVWIGVRLALKPLDDIEHRIAKQSPRELTPLPIQATPIELNGMIGRLNILLATMAEGSQAERTFLESAAHQLRTPLAGMLAQLELLLADSTEDGRGRRARLALESAQRLAHTTHQLLTLARSEHRLHTYAERADVDLAALAAERVGAHVSRALEGGIDLGVELQPALVHGIRWLLSEALDNLLGNSITYTPPGGLVTVRTGVIADLPFLDVTDSGQGIAPEEREKVLSRFYRGSNSRGEGSGLGLAIVADVARQHGASLQVEEGPGGRGVRIRLYFLPRGIDTVPT